MLIASMTPIDVQMYYCPRWAVSQARSESSPNSLWHQRRELLSPSVNLRSPLNKSLSVSISLRIKHGPWGAMPLRRGSDALLLRAWREDKWVEIGCHLQPVPSCMDEKRSQHPQCCPRASESDQSDWVWGRAGTLRKFEKSINQDTTIDEAQFGII